MPWSASNTLDRTLARLRDRGLETASLAPWFDVDPPSDLARLKALIARGEIDAPATARVFGLAP